MGRGVAYQYPHHVIVHQLDLYEGLPELGDMEEGDVWPYEESDRIDDESILWEDFKKDVIAAFRAEEIYTIPDGREAYLFAETNRLYIGIDYGGADYSPCVYLKPKTYERLRIHYVSGFEFGDYEEFDYVLNGDAERGFNRLIKQYGNTIVYWTSGYTTSPYGKQKDGSYLKYGRKEENA